MRNNYDNIELRETKISEGVPHVEYYVIFGVFRPEFFQTICKVIGNCVSVNAVLQRSNNNDGVKPMEWQGWKLS